jgi:hypothetical protein
MTLIQQLHAENKTLIAQNKKLILVYWHSDDSYVSWRVHKNENGYYFELGKYMPAPYTPNNTEVAMENLFYPRINK